MLGMSWRESVVKGGRKGAGDLKQRCYRRGGEVIELDLVEHWKGG